MCLSHITARLYSVVVCACLNESATARRVFFTGGGASKMAAAAAIGEQKIQDFQPGLR